MARSPEDRRRLLKRISLLLAGIVAGLVLVGFLARPGTEGTRGRTSLQPHPGREILVTSD